MNLSQRIKKAPSKYRSEIALTVMSAAVGIALGKIADPIIGAPLFEQVQLGLLCAAIAFLVGISITLRRSVVAKVELLEQKVGEISGQRLPNLYDRRKLHFVLEKSRLVEHLVRTIIPDALARAAERLGSPVTDKRIALVVDSGTTLEPLFARLKAHGLGNIGESIAMNVRIYTNSLSGSNSFCEEPSNALREEQLRLFGGTQIEKYKAVLGDITTLGVRSLGNSYREQGGYVIGIITSNWFLVGGAYDRLVFCSIEQKHLDYKREICELADLLIITSPLGKLLRFNSPDELNTALKRREEGLSEYRGFDIKDVNKRNHDNTLLVSTHRKRRGSILHWHSAELVRASRGHNLYAYEGMHEHLALDHRVSKDRQMDIEIPHEYLRQLSRTALPHFVWVAVTA